MIFIVYQSVGTLAVLLLETIACDKFSHKRCCLNQPVILQSAELGNARFCVMEDLENVSILHRDEKVPSDLYIDLFQLKFATFVLVSFMTMYFCC